MSGPRARENRKQEITSTIMPSIFSCGVMLYDSHNKADKLRAVGKEDGGRYRSDDEKVAL